MTNSFPIHKTDKLTYRASLNHSSRCFVNSNDGEILLAGINERDIAGGSKD